MTSPSVSWRVDKILRELHPYDKLAGRCKRRNITPPEPATLRMWKHRASIPSAWLPTILMVLDLPAESYMKKQRRLRTPPTNPF